MVMTKPAQRALVFVLLLILLAACSGEAANGSSGPAVTAALAAPGGGAASSNAEPRFSESAIAEQQRFDDQRLAALAESNIACSLLKPEDLAQVFGTEFSAGRFSWFESELRRAPASLSGICVYAATGLPASTSVSTVTLRVYESSDIAWALNQRDDEDFTRRFSQRSMEAAPEIAERAYRKPHGADGFDLTCADLGRHIACLSAHFRLTENWVDKDRAIMERLREGLASLD